MDEAEVDDDAEDDDDDDLEEGFEQLINKDEDEEEGTSESFRHQRRLDHLLQMQEEDKLEEYYRCVLICVSQFCKFELYKTYAINFLPQTKTS